MAAVSERDIVRAATSLGYTTVRENQMRAILEFSKGSDVFIALVVTFCMRWK